MGTRLLTFDDLDGTSPAETVTFALNGVQYELDLSEANTLQLQAALQPYINAAQTRIAAPSPVLALEAAVALEPVLPAAIEAAVSEPHLIVEEVTATEETSAPKKSGRKTAASKTKSTKTAKGSKGAKASARSSKRSTAPVIQAPQVRAWAAEHGLQLGGRGPLTASVLSEYLSAHDLPTDTTVAPGPVKTRTPRGSQTPRRAVEPKRASTATDAGSEAPSAASSTDVSEQQTPAASDAASAVTSTTTEQPVSVSALSGSAAVRAWAKSHGLPTHATGPVPKSVTNAFEEAVDLVAPKRNKGRVYPPGIREWARSAGFKVGNGKISEEILRAYTAVH